MNHKFDFQSNTKFIVMLIFIVGLILRTLFIHSLRLDYDEGLFLSIGYLYQDNIVEGILNNFTYKENLPLNQPPLVSLLYSVLYSFFPIDYGVGRLINIILGAICIILVYIIVKEIWDHKVGLVAAIIVMIDPTLTMAILMTMDGLTTFFLCVSCFAIVKAIKTDTLKWHLTSGVTFGLCMLTKWTLAVVPITYVVFYIYYSNRNKKQPLIMSIKKIIASASIALAIFLPWFILMGVNGIAPRLFSHGHNFRLTNPLNNIYQTWAHSPVLFLLVILAFMYFFLNNKETQFPLLYGLFIIFPFFLIMPRYYDYAPILYLFAIFGAKPCLNLFEQAFILVTKITTSRGKLEGFDVDINIILSTTIIFLLLVANFGSITKVALFDQDQTVQQTVAYMKENTSENSVIICPPHFGSLMVPRTWIHSLDEGLEDKRFLIYTPIKQYYAAIYCEGVELGSVTEDNMTFLFVKTATINNVIVYQLTVNQTSFQLF